MAGAVSGLITFGTQNGPIATGNLDTNFTAFQTAVNSANSYSNYLVDSGSANTIAVTIASPAAATLSAGLTLTIKVAQTNTGATTLNLNGGGAVAVVDPLGAPLASNDLNAGGIFTFVYNGTYWQVLGALASGSTGVAFADTFTATAGQTVFTLSNNPGNINNLGVSLDGSVLVASIDYTWTSPETLTLTAGAKAGQTLFVRYIENYTIGTPIAAGTNNQIQYNNSGVLNGTTIGGDATLVATTGALTVTKTAGVAFAASATTNTTLTGNINYTQGGTGSVARTVTNKFQESVSVKDFGAVGDGSTDNTAAIQNAINYVSSVGGTLTFPTGVFLCSSTLIFKNNVNYIGSGIDLAGIKGTVIKYTGASDAIQINNPINSSTSANIYISDIHVYCTTQTAGKASIADVGSSYLTIERVATYGNQYGVILDQSEIVRLQNCYIIAPAGGVGVWLVNGAGHTVGANSFYTNQITIDGCQFNTTTGVHIADDGGNTHVFTNNNFNAGSISCQITDTYNLLIQGNSFETATTTEISFSKTMLLGTAGNYSSAVSIRCNSFSSTAAIAFITFSNTSATRVVVESNNFVNANVSGTPFSGVSAGVTGFYGVGNNQFGTGSSVVGNTMGDYSSYTPVLSSTNSDASLGNGTITGTYARSGTNITVNISMFVGTTTVLGTGQWLFSLPFNALEPYSVGSFIAVPAGVYKAGSVDVYTNSKCRLYENTVGILGGASYAWVSTNQVKLTITYQMAQSS